MKPIETSVTIQHKKSKWTKIVLTFLSITVIWNVIEATFAIHFGIKSNEESLFAFGIDSLIEVLSASLVLYHMVFNSSVSFRNKTITASNTKSVLFSLETERKCTLFIGFLLILFCLFACIAGILRLIYHIPPKDTLSGVIISIICIVVMFIMYYYKTKASVILNSATLASDAACSLGCIKLSFVLCIGSILFIIWHKLWWVDAVTSIIMGIMVGYEGYETIKTAKDKDNFFGGCGCCGATKSGLAKYLMERIKKEINTDIQGFSNCDEEDCDSDGDECQCVDAKIDCCNDDCCNDGDECCGTSTKEKCCDKEDCYQPALNES